MQGFNIADIEHYCELIYGKSRDDLYLVPYGYPLNVAALPASAQITRTIQLSANADFLCMGIAHFVTTASQALTVGSKFAPNIRVLLSDASSGDPFTQSAAPLESISENGLGRVFLPFPRLLQGRGAVNAQIINDDTDTPWVNLQIYLHGVLIRAWSEAPQSRLV
jgi:hypothetical protein